MELKVGDKIKVKNETGIYKVLAVWPDGRVYFMSSDGISGSCYSGYTDIKNVEVFKCVTSK